MKKEKQIELVKDRGNEQENILHGCYWYMFTYTQKKIHREVDTYPPCIIVFAHIHTHAHNKIWIKHIQNGIGVCVCMSMAYT